ncbi:hypothetical protein BIFADO_00766 [Bifidobacterium adolescentis L2-32]|uniref:Uncharacterized protein n=1 Tax=Bifidobacterium adolescentis L2-32 TaxID=411481 RepID=A7A4K8_BIFAD|nr:hypothetical protein BIFADO_00766 [Bifidobacterium adolescentis L2-32]
MQEMFGPRAASLWRCVSKDFSDWNTADMIRPAWR